MNSGSEWEWRLLDVFAQSKDDVEMWVDAPGGSLSSPPSLHSTTLMETLRSIMVGKTL